MNGNRGFTLIEMMIAIFIGLIIFTIGFTAISSTMSVRKESEAKIRATANAQLLFNLMRKDLEGAYPINSAAVNLSTLSTESSYIVTYLGKPVSSITDRMELFITPDLRGKTDQYTFVRYFVNSYGHLCRQVVSGSDPVAIIPPFDKDDDSAALFDGAFAMHVNWSQFDDSAKSFTPPLPNFAPPPIAANATHLKVDLFLFGLDAAPQNQRLFSAIVQIPPPLLK